MVLSGHVPQNSDAVNLGDSLGFMLIPSFFRFNAKVFAALPVHVCCGLVVVVDIFSFSQFRQPETRLVYILGPCQASLGYCVATSMLGDFDPGLR